MCGRVRRRGKIGGGGVGVGVGIENARPAEQRDARGAGADEQPGTGIGGGAAGVDIVDEHDVATAEPCRGIGGERERPRQRPAARGRAHRAQRRRRAAAADQLGQHGQPHGAGDRAGDEQRLVEPARPEAAAVQRDGNHQIGIGREQPPHRARHRLGEREAAAIFEAERDAARDGAIGDRGAHTVVRRRIGKARCAACPLPPVLRERAVAMRAPGRSEEAQPGPARGAEAVVGIGHGAAAGAARGQRQRGDPGKGGGGTHMLLSPRAGRCTSGRVSDSEIFDRALRRRRRDRARSDYAGHDFLRQHMLEGIADRLAMVKRPFADVLDLGCFDAAFDLPGARIARMDAGFGFARAAGGVQGDEDRMPFADASFDLVVCAGVLDQVNDVPGALALARRVLRPDGLFLGAFLGAGTLTTLRSTMMAAEAERPAARFHPQIEVRAAGDLLTRAGFALQVADVETLTVRYAGLARLLGDLRGMAATSLLPGAPPIGRATLAAAAAEFAERADPDGRTPERFEIVYLTGWAPDPSQPKAARPGSATASLAAALNARH